MTITIPDEIERVAQGISSLSGVAVDSVLLRALETHFLAVPRELQEEFDAWELASDQDMAAFEEREREPAAVETR